MTNTAGPFVHITIDAVDAVALDPHGLYDPELHDHYDTFESARDAALTSVELMLDEGDYDGEDHREELERMREMLEHSATFEALAELPDYQWFLDRIRRQQPVAA